MRTALLLLLAAASAARAGDGPRYGNTLSDPAFVMRCAEAALGSAVALGNSGQADPAARLAALALDLATRAGNTALAEVAQKKVEEYRKPPAPRTRYAEFALSGNQLTLPSPVRFATGSERIHADSDAALWYVRDFLEARKDVTLLRIEVHCEPGGDLMKAADLTKRRAAAAARWLAAHGVEPGRLLPVGFGGTKPVAEGTTPEAKAANRRAVFAVAELDGKAVGGQEVDGGGARAEVEYAVLEELPEDRRQENADLLAKLNATLVTRYEGASLDGSLSDLVILQRIVTDGFGRKRRLEERSQLGRALGEVIVREFGGRWVFAKVGNTQPLAVARGGMWVAPIDELTESFSGGNEEWTSFDEICGWLQAMR